MHSLSTNCHTPHTHIHTTLGFSSQLITVADDGTLFVWELAGAVAAAADAGPAWRREEREREELDLVRIS